MRISAYGQTGPYRDLPGFARIAHAFSGLAYLAGEADGPPVTPGSTSLADYLTGIYGVVGALLALRARETTGEGQCVDLTLYEPIFRVLDELAPAFEQFGIVRERMGPDTVNVVPHGHFEAADGRWIAIACSNDDMFARLAKAMGRPELAAADAWGPKEARLAERARVNDVVGQWVGSMARDEVLDVCRTAQVPAGPIYSIADIFEDPQYAHRETIVQADSRIGPLSIPGTLPGVVRHAGRDPLAGARARIPHRRGAARGAPPDGRRDRRPPRGRHRVNVTILRRERPSPRDAPGRRSADDEVIG